VKYRFVTLVLIVLAVLGATRAFELRQFGIIWCTQAQFQWMRGPTWISGGVVVLNATLQDSQGHEYTAMVAYFTPPQCG